MLFKRGFFWKLLALSTAVALPLLVLHAYTVYDGFRFAQRSAYTLIEGRSASAAHSLEDALQRAENLATFLAERREVRAGSTAECNALLRAVPQLDNFVSRFVLVRADGQVLCSTADIPATLGFAGAAWVANGLGSHGISLTAPVTSRVDGRKLAVLSRQVVRDNGQLLGVLGIALDLERIAEHLATGHHLGPGETLTLLNERSLVLARYPGGEQWTGHRLPEEAIGLRKEAADGVVTARSLEGTMKAFASTTLSRHKLRVAAGMPVETMFSGPRELAAESIAVAALVVLLMGCLSVYGATWLERPVRRILVTIRRRATGDRGQVPENLPGEFKTLAVELNRLSAARDAVESSLLEAKQQAQRMRDFYAALSSINELMVRRPEPRVLFEQMCRTVVATRHAQLAWVGLRQDNAVVAAASAGEATGYIESIVPMELPQDPDAMLGPVAHALLTGEPCIVEDFATDVRTRPWRVRAARYGIRSIATFPLRCDGAVVGMLGVYSTETNFFSPELVALFKELAADASFALDDREREAQRQARERAEEQARQERAKAEAANQAKTQFISRMSHELRTPLNAVLGFTQLLQASAQGRLSADELRQLDYVYLAGAQLRALIDDVLDVSRLEAGTLALDLQDVRLGEVLDNVMALSNTQAQEHDVKLRGSYSQHAHLVVHTDTLRLRQVLLNILSNAIKYNHAQGRVTLSVERRPGRLDIVVRDTGMGMTEQQLAQIFQPFNRLGRERLGIEGTGIGMAITRQLVELLGGQLGLDSTSGVGTTVRVSLPYAQSEETLPVPPQLAAGDATPVRLEELEDTTVSGTVLYVEDNPVNAMLVQQLLRHWPSLKLVIATDGATGLERAAELMPDIVLLDMYLPDMGGIDIIRELRAHPKTQHLTVIALSASAMESDVREALHTGAAEYWTKPIDIRPFLEGLRRLLPRKADAQACTALPAARAGSSAHAARLIQDEA